ncbi:site-specific integrase, partial [Parabacteroides sp.]
MKQYDLAEGMRMYIARLREQGRYSSAKSYQDALNSFLRFCGQEVIPYTRIDREMLLRYQDYLRDRECSWNTVSTYMRRIRRVYGLAMENGEAPFSRYLFKGIFMGVKSKQKKALPTESLRLLMTAPLDDSGLRKTQRALCLMFLFCGMAFVDFAHLKKSDIRSGVLGSPDKSGGKFFNSIENLHLCTMNNQGLLALAQLILPSEILSNFEVV